MGKNTRKREVISELVGRADKALQAGFYLETIFIYHALIEERVVSSAKKEHPSLGKRNKIPGSIRKIKIHQRQPISAYDKKYFPPELLKNINAWKDERDKLIHAIESGSHSEEHKCNIAVSGQKLFKTIASKIMQWKKTRKKKGKNRLYKNLSISNL